jgi:hypothetical protein
LRETQLPAHINATQKRGALSASLYFQDRDWQLEVSGALRMAAIAINLNGLASALA